MLDGARLGGVGEIRIAGGSSPRFPHPIGIEREEDCGHDQKDAFIEWSRNRKQPNGGQPPKWPWDLLVASENRDSVDQASGSSHCGRV